MKQKKLLSNTEEAMLHFANLLCSKICHDIVGPLGAVHNGFELLEDANDDEERRNIENAMHNSCNSALSKLTFERLALGVGGSTSGEMSVESLRDLCDNYFNSDNKRISFTTKLKSLNKSYCRVLLNVLMIMPSLAPRCGTVYVHIGGSSPTPFFRVSAQSSYARLGEQVTLLLERKSTISDLHSRNIHPFYTGMIAAHSGIKITVRKQQDVIHALIEKTPIE